ncbi:MAG: BolA family transcriptional regulator [Proteobacteria bacterium]|nr:BolA family transcriptional regulator [Pseudomonadota bacterium]
MGPSAAEIERLIRERMPDADVTASDLRGDGNHFAAHVVSPSFKGLNRVDQHRMVFEALKDVMGKGMPALALQTSVPE